MHDRNLRLLSNFPAFILCARGYHGLLLTDTKQAGLCFVRLSFNAIRSDVQLLLGVLITSLLSFGFLVSCLSKIAQSQILVHI
jgi:hypothetical protein